MNRSNLLKNLFFCSLLGMALLVAFDGYFDKRLPLGNLLPKMTTPVLNPLDAIRGDKQSDDGSVRKANFQDLLRIRASFLEDSSGLYAVQEVTESTFLLTRKKFFHGNRHYSLFVKTRGDCIVSYRVLDDLLVRGAVYAAPFIYFITDEYEVSGNPWNRVPAYAAGITCMDMDFKNQWKTTSLAGTGYFFFGRGIAIKGNQLVATLEVQREGSSTMCTNTYQLILGKTGKPKSQRYLGGYSCGPASDGLNLLACFPEAPELQK